MEHVSGKIMHGEDIVYDDLRMWIDIREHGSVKSWHGGFTPPAGTYVELGETYRLNLRDGRQGDMFVKKVSLGSHKATSVLFQGSGPLAR